MGYPNLSKKSAIRSQTNYRCSLLQFSAFSLSCANMEIIFLVSDLYCDENSLTSVSVRIFVSKLGGPFFLPKVRLARAFSRPEILLFMLFWDLATSWLYSILWRDRSWINFFRDCCNLWRENFCFDRVTG